MRIRLLGRPGIFSPREDLVDGLPKKAFAIAGLISRDSSLVARKPEIAEFLWPNLATPQSANNLRQLLYRVRQFELDNALTIFTIGEREISFADGATCDVTALEAIASTSSSADAVLAAYGGTFLEGIRIPGHSAHRWLADQRVQLEDQFVDALLASTSEMPSLERRAVLERGVLVAPRAIGPRKALMRQLISGGAISEARRQFREIQRIAGPGAVAAPPELFAEPVVGQQAMRHPAVPLVQLGRDVAGVPHLALLPPRSSQPAGAMHRMAEALVDDVTIALTRLRSLSVLAPHTARRVAGSDDAGVLARADFVLRTKVTENATGRRGRPSLVLVLERASSGDIVWADRMELGAEMGPIAFASLANGIALTLVDQIERATLRSFEAPAAGHAYGHYLLGQQALQVLDLPSTRRARASFKTAFTASPNFAPAHTGYSQSLIYEWVMRGQSNDDLLVRARGAAELAREIDPLFGSAHQMLGRSSLFVGDFDSSLAHFERAEALNPHHADLLCDFADTLMHSSLAQRANDKIELALKLNPLAPDAYWWASAGIKFFVEEYDGALSHLGKVQNSEPVLRLTAACAAMAGKHDLARFARDRFLSMHPSFSLDDWIGVMPLKDHNHRRHYRQALQRAGFK